MHKRGINAAVVVCVDRIQALRQFVAVLFGHVLRQRTLVQFAATETESLGQRIARVEQGVRKRNGSLHNGV